MTIFTRKFSEDDRVNRTTVARWHKPNGDDAFNQPDWALIEVAAKNRANTEFLPDPPAETADPELQDPSHPLKATSAFSFDELELASIAAKTASLAYQEGIAAGHDMTLARQNELLAQIRAEVAAFSASVELPFNAIKRELFELVSAVVDTLCTADSPERRQAMLEASIESSLASLKAVNPLTLLLHPDDMACIDELLTKFRDNPGTAEIEVKPSSELEPGQIAVAWPGGGMERVVAARHAALHSLIEQLAPPAEDDANGTDEQGELD